MSLMQTFIYGNFLADFDDLVEIIKHILSFVFVCHFRRDVCQQFKTSFNGYDELLIACFECLDIGGHLFRS